MWAPQLGDYVQACIYAHIYARRTHLYLPVYKAEKVEERAKVMFKAAAAALNYGDADRKGFVGNSSDGEDYNAAVSSLVFIRSE